MQQQARDRGPMGRPFSAKQGRPAATLGWISIGIATALPAAALVGWLLGIEALKTIVPHATAMRVITVVCLLLSAAALSCLHGPGCSGWRSRLPQVVGVVVGIVGMLTVASYLVEGATGHPWSLSLAPGANLFLAGSTRMAIITAILFSVLGAVLLLLATGTARAAHAAHVALLPVALLSYMVLAGYLFHVQALYEWMHLGVALNTGLVFCALCLAALCARPDTPLMQVFAGEESGALMARRLLPGLLALPLFIGWLRIEGERAGLFSSDLGVALVTVTYMLSFLAMTWHSARAVNRTDRRRRQYERALRESEELARARAEELRIVLDAVPAAVWIAHDPESRVITGNAYADELIMNVPRGGNISRSAMPGEAAVTYRAFRDGEELTPDQLPAQRAAATRQTVPEEVIDLTFPDGRQVNLLASATPLFDAEGQVRGAVVAGADVTPLRKAQDALQRSEQRWATTLASIGDAVIATDPAGAVAFMNPIAEELTGWTLQEAARKPVTDIFRIVNDQTLEEAESPVARVLREGVVVGLANHTILIRRDGTELPIDDSGAPIRDEQGEVAGVVLVFRDITERKQAEQALRESEARFRAIAASTPDHLLVQDRELRYTFVLNPQFGLTEKDMLGRTDHDLLNRADAERLTAIKRRVVETGETIHLELPLAGPDGETKYFEGTYVPQLDAEGHPNGLIGYFRDVTERKHAEEALRESEARYRSLFENMLDGYAYCQILYEDGAPRDFVFLDVNASFERLTGLKNVIGKRVSEVIPGIWETDPNLLEIYRRVARSGQSERFETYLDSLRIWFSIAVYSPAKDHFVAVFDNISARKQAEEALLQAERTRTRLAQTLTSEIAHRTKNNLAIVAGLLQLSLDREPGPDSHAALIGDAVTRIMSFAALHEQMYQRHSEAVELLDALRRIAEVDRQALSVGEVSISVEGEAAEFPASAATNLCVVANELITNAVKHGDAQQGAHQVEVRLNRDEGRLALLVWNSHSGVPPSFDVRFGSGTGLGLVRTIVVDQYGGSFELLPERGGALARVVLDEQRLREG